MILSKPIWSSTNKTYTINVLNHEAISYTELKNTSGDDFFKEPDINKKDFQELFMEFIKEFIEFSKDIFSTPIKDTIFIKKSKHIFQRINETDNYGKRCLFTWKPIKIVISSMLYEIYWDIDIVLLDTAIQSEQIESETTNIVEANEEIQEIVNISPEQDNQNKSRALFLKKVREAKMKAAIATMKAERLAARYFRRYGNDLNVSYESDLSSDSDEEIFDNNSK